MAIEYTEVLNFWFGKPGDREYGLPRKFWFTKDTQFDLRLKSCFKSIYQQAKTGKLDDWRENPLSCLALIVVLDQFPRNMFRGLPEAFATDSKALAMSRYALEHGYDRQLLSVQRWFIYLPFEHSENLADQKISVQLFSSLKNCPHSKNTINYACRHYEIIDRFGRFPHRNHILGRENTPEETAFLQQPGSGF